MQVDAQQHPQETMAEIARIIDEWRYGPKLSETALSEIRVLTLAYEAARSAEPVAWCSEGALKMAAAGVPAIIHAYPPPVDPVALYRHPKEASDA